MNKVEDLYKKNDEFRRYVDAYAKTHKITPETAMTHKLVVNVADNIRSRLEVRG